MADDKETLEGWDVPQRPAVWSAAAIIAALALSLTIAGYLYDHHLRQATYRPPTALPGPGLDTSIHPSARDPALAAPQPVPAPEIVTAKRRVVAQGLAGWVPQP